MSTATDTDGRLALVTGVTGYVGGRVAAELLRRGWRIRVLSRSADKVRDSVLGVAVVDDGAPAGPGEVEIVEGDAGDAEVLRRALEGVDCAWYLLHSMGDAHDFAGVEREMARTFAEAALTSGAGRIVYLGGLHPRGEELSEHLGSRVEVGQILMDSGVPTAALQAGVVIGDGSSSFIMLRHLAERLPAAVAPKWIRNRIQPIAVNDVVHYLVGAADLSPGITRTFDVGGPEAMSYADMMKRYATANGRLPRLVLSAPVTTTGLAAHWIGLVTPVPVGLATPLIGSLLHDTVVSERDLDGLIGPPPGGVTGYDEAVREATSSVDTSRWPRTLGITAGAAATAGALRALGSRRRGGASAGFPTGLPVVLPDLAALVDLTAVAALSLADLRETGRGRDASRYTVVLGAQLAVFALGGAKPDRGGVAADLAALALLAGASELVRRSWLVSPQKGVALLPHAVWAALGAGTRLLRRG